MDIVVGVVCGLAVFGVLIGGGLFLRRLWDFLGRKTDNSKKED